MCYFVTKIVLTYSEKNCSSDQNFVLKFEAEGREFANILRSLEQFFLTVGQNNFGNKIPLLLCFSHKFFTDYFLTNINGLNLEIKLKNYNLLSLDLQVFYVNNMTLKICKY